MSLRDAWSSAGRLPLIAMAVLVVMASAMPSTCVADVPPREFVEDRDIPARSAAVPFTVGQNGRSEGHRIVIPAKLLADLVKSGKADNADGSRLRSIVAAIAVSAAVACGLVASTARNRRASRRAVVAGCGCVSLAAAVALAATTAFADLLPPGGGPRRPRPVPAAADQDDGEQPRRASGTVVIEVAEEGREVLLLIGRGGLAKP